MMTGIERSVRERGAGLAGLLAAGALALAAGEAVAQERPSAAAAGLRAVEVLDPSSGDRARSLLRPLTPSERLRIEASLAEAGHRPGEVDGVFDRATARALRSFQRAQELRACGCVDLATVEALGVDVRVVMTEIASGAAELRRSAPGRGASAGEASTVAGVEVVYPTTPSPASESPPSGAARAAGADQAQTGMEGAAREGPGGSAVRYHRGGVFTGSTLGVPVLVVDSAGRLVPFSPGLPVTTPAPGGTAGRSGASPFSRHRVPLPPIRGGGRPPAGGGGSDG